MRFLLIFIPLFLFADSFFLDIAKDTDSNNKYFALGISKNTPIYSLPTYTSIDVGGWGSNESLSFVSINEGIKYGDRLFLKAQIGLSLISNTTKNLSTTLEFSEKVSIGTYIGKNSLSLFFRHFSNANIKKPNGGESFIGLSFLTNF
ncbi:acyloxyacyl hydrolase [Nitrosophilus kaiyonis]|uniref:acyloxyacyl hydrolase n=1 Tax=Nitrosophilus kaiyonis TaxID=2930200 RepID=UPI0024916215|nr:acyloxyacyl hydrolase [Nitrosophilus kaiyonis]